MAEVPLPFVEHISASDVIEIAEERGTLRKTDLEDEIDAPDDELDTALVRAVERGDVALFPVGDSVQIRYEDN
jgi:hypothetical protein